MANRYLSNVTPTIKAHGAYHYTSASREHAVEWVREHHKELHMVGPGPNNGIDVQLVNLFAKEIDRYIETRNVVMPELEPHDEILVAAKIPHTPGRQNIPLTLDSYTYSLLKRQE